MRETESIIPIEEDLWNNSGDWEQQDVGECFEPNLYIYKAFINFYTKTVRKVFYRRAQKISFDQFDFRYSLTIIHAETLYMYFITIKYTEYVHNNFLRSTNFKYYFHFLNYKWILSRDQFIRHVKVLEYVMRYRP